MHTDVQILFDMVKAERFCHIHTGIEDSCVTRVKGLSPLRGVGQSPAYLNKNSFNKKNGTKFRFLLVSYLILIVAVFFLLLPSVAIAVIFTDFPFADFNAVTFPEDETTA